MSINKVLVVDDSKLARLTLSRLLKQKDIEVIEAESVSRAMDILNNEAVDAVFMDVMMPEQDGFDGLRLIREDSRLQHLPCSMYSGDLSMEAQNKAMDSGAQAYLFKPANEMGLETVLETLASGIKPVTDDGAPALTTSVDVGTSAATVANTAAYDKTLATLDNRTKNLAKVVMQERKVKAEEQKILQEQVKALSEEIHSLESQETVYEHQEREHQRIENDLRGQLKNTRESLKWVGIIAAVSAAVALLSLILIIAD